MQPIDFMDICCLGSFADVRKDRDHHYWNAKMMMDAYSNAYPEQHQEHAEKNKFMPDQSFHKNPKNGKFSLDTMLDIWYFMGRLLKKAILLRTHQDLRQGVPTSIGICPGMIGAEVKPRGGTLCPRLP